MKNLPVYASNFASFRGYEAMCQTKDGEVEILLEFRETATEEELIYTIWEGEEVRTSSIHKLASTMHGLIALRIRHTVRVLWSGALLEAELSEEFFPARDPQGIPIADLRVRLTINGKRYESESVTTLQDAILDLREKVGDEANWRVGTCYECAYSGQARDYATSDRKYWCYRDAPSAWREIQAKGKYASVDARFAGNYFVDAFHCCAAWKPLD